MADEGICPISPFKLKLPPPHKILSPLVMFIRLTFGNNKAQPPRTARPHKILSPLVMFIRLTFGNNKAQPPRTARPI